MRRRLVQFGAHMLSWAAAFLFAFGLIEIYTRAVVDTGTNFDLEMWKYTVHVKEPDPQGVGHQNHPGATGHLMGVDVKINALGQRDRDFPMAKPANTVRIMMLGDSIAFGWGVPFEKTTAKLLEQRLNATAPAGKTIEVINTAVVDYNTYLEVEHFLRDGARMDPDIVVLNYFINDAEPTPRPGYPWWARYSYGLIFLGQRIDILRREFGRSGDWRQYYNDLYASDAAGWALARESMRKLAEYCHARGIKVVLANMPELHELSEYPFKDVNRKIEEAAKDAGLPYLDMLPAVAGMDGRTLWVAQSDAHPNPIATEKYANRLAEYLTPYVVADGHVASRTTTH